MLNFPTPFSIFQYGVSPDFRPYQFLSSLKSITKSGIAVSGSDDVSSAFTELTKKNENNKMQTGKIRILFMNHIKNI